MTNARRSGAYTAVASEAAKDPMSFLSRVTAVPGMVRDVLLGRYTGLGKGKLFLMLLAVGYIVSPIDLLPEAILTIPGLADDAVVAADMRQQAEPEDVVAYAGKKYHLNRRPGLPVDLGNHSRAGGADHPIALSSSSIPLNQAANMLS